MVKLFTDPNLESTPNRVINHLSVCDDDIGEMDAFFDEDVLIAHWANNDAMYRHEYMQYLFEYLGVTINQVDEGSRLGKKLLKKLKEVVDE